MQCKTQSIARLMTTTMVVEEKEADHCKGCGLQIWIPELDDELPMQWNRKYKYDPSPKSDRSSRHSRNVDSPSSRKGSWKKSSSTPTTPTAHRDASNKFGDRVFSPRQKQLTREKEENSSLTSLRQLALQRNLSQRSKKSSFGTQKSTPRPHSGLSSRSHRTTPAASEDKSPCNTEVHEITEDDYGSIIHQLSREDPDDTDTWAQPSRQKRSKQRPSSASSARSARSSNPSLSSSRKDRNVSKDNETIYLQTFHKVMAALSDSEKSSHALKHCDSERMYRRVVFSIMQKALDSSGSLVPEQRDVVLHGLQLICADGSQSPSHTGLHEHLADTLCFLHMSFHGMISVDSSKVKDEARLMSVIDLAGSICAKSAYCREKVHEHRILEKLIDEIVLHTTPAHKTTDSIVDKVSEVVYMSQLMVSLFHRVKAVISSMLSTQDIELEVAREHLSRMENTSALLRDSRRKVSNMLDAHGHFTTMDKTCFKAAEVVSETLRLCVLEDPLSCSHTLKLCFSFSSSRVMGGQLLFDSAPALVKVLAAMLRSAHGSGGGVEDDSEQQDVDGEGEEEDVGGQVKDRLMQLWLVQRACENANVRVLLLRTEGVIPLVLALMQSVPWNVGQDLEKLRPLTLDSSLLDPCLSHAQVIQRLGEVIQFGACEEARQSSYYVLCLLAEGLLDSSGHWSHLSASFTDSGIVYMLLNGCGEASSLGEHSTGGERWQSRGAELLATLVKNKDIRRAFVEEPLSILQCLVESCDTFLRRSVLIMCFLGVLGVLAEDADTHLRLLESSVINVLISFIKEALSTSSTVMHEDDKEKCVLGCLRVIESMALAADSSVALLKDGDVDSFLRLLLLHERKTVRDLVSRILERMGSSSTPSSWKVLFAASKSTSK